MIKLSLYLCIFFTTCQNSVIDWKLKLSESPDGGIQLVNFMKYKEPIDIILDRKAFSYSCYYGEDIDLNGKDIPKVSDFQYSQIIIENMAGNKRLFSNVYFEGDEIKEIPDDNCMYDWHDSLHLNNEYISFKIDVPYLSDLKVESQDKKVRLIYLFKASDNQKKRGYQDLILKSNVLNLY